MEKKNCINTVSFSYAILSLKNWKEQYINVHVNALDMLAIKRSVCFFMLSSVNIIARYIIRNAISLCSRFFSRSWLLFFLFLWLSTNTLFCVCVSVCVHIFNFEEFSINGAIFFYMDANKWVCVCGAQQSISWRIIKFISIFHAKCYKTCLTCKMYIYILYMYAITISWNGFE